jgi:peptide/nickel transport system ATP-binding protein
LSEVLLDVRNLTAVYLTPVGVVRAVDRVSFSVNKGESVGIAGESGSGKSTLVNAILNALRPPALARGEVLFQGRNLLNLSKQDLDKIRWRKISYIPQSSMNALNPVLKIRDQFLHIIKSHYPKMGKGEVMKTAAESLLNVRLDPGKVLEAYPHELSGGMRQRVAIALAICLKPDLIIADEPTTALDVVTQKEILRLLRELKVRMDLTLIFVSHDISVLAEVAESLMIMYGGKIVEAQRLNDVLENPLHPYTKGLISSIPSLSKEKISSIPGDPPDLMRPPRGCIFHPRCPYKMEVCEREEPPTLTVSKGSKVACHLYRGGGRVG